MYFENEVGSGELQSSIQKPCILQECQRNKIRVIESVWTLFELPEILARRMSVERLTGVFQVQPRIPNM